ncbi:hypothetical protein LNO89_02875 [Klebsiella pneumoniae subsp. pneumoniae]|nr:hypothetical protein [Klebsiella pneumoniae subsp. pneumoniae]
MYKEVNTPAPTCRRRSISTASTVKNTKFLCMAKGGGSANKTYLYQETQGPDHPGEAEKLPR